MWNWLIRPKGRNKSGWSDLATGSLLFVGGIVLVVIAYDTALTIASAALIVSGIRWIAVGAVHLRDRAASQN